MDLALHFTVSLLLSAIFSAAFGRTGLGLLLGLSLALGLGLTKELVGVEFSNQDMVANLGGALLSLFIRP